MDPSKAVMRISYRISSGAVLATVGLLIVTNALLPVAQQRPKATEQGAVGWDPCSLWEQMAPTVRLATLVCFGAFLVHLVQGLRNRPAPRWLGIAGLPALGLTVNHQLWWINRCSTPSHELEYFIWVAAVGLMFLHHAIQRHAGA
jgi:hypothetical protein